MLFFAGLLVTVPLLSGTAGQTRRIVEGPASYITALRKVASDEATVFITTAGVAHASLLIGNRRHCLL